MNRSFPALRLEAQTTWADFPSAIQLIAAPFTPMKTDGDIAFDRIPDYAGRLYRDGIGGVFVGGTSGEGLSLTVTERMNLAQAWCEATANRLPMIVHVGHASIREAVSLARHAATLPVSGIAAIGPIFFTAGTASALVHYCRDIAAAAPQLPFYYYHMPSMSRVPLAASDVLPALIETIPNFRGIKFTHEDLPDYARCLKLAGNRYEIFFGRDELLFNGLQLGARAAVGSTYNFAAPLYLRMARAWKDGDAVAAQRLQALCTRAIEVMVRHDGLVGIKATLSLCGLDCGPVRLPLRTLSGKQLTALRNELDQIGFFEELQAARLTPAV